MSTPVLNHSNAVIDAFLRWMNVVANHDDFTFTDLGFFEVAQFWNFSQQANIAPMSPVENFVQFFGVNTWVGIDPKWNATGLSALPSLRGVGGCDVHGHDAVITLRLGSRLGTCFLSKRAPNGQQAGANDKG